MATPSASTAVNALPLHSRAGLGCTRPLRLETCTNLFSSTSLKLNSHLDLKLNSHLDRVERCSSFAWALVRSVRFGQGADGWTEPLDADDLIAVEHRQEL
jgi:hypothetical protein